MVGQSETMTQLPDNMKVLCYLRSGGSIPMERRNEWDNAAQPQNQQP